MSDIASKFKWVFGTQEAFANRVQPGNRLVGQFQPL